ncbi:MAG: TOBE domain-containing protein [Candidatus Obscuribacterales bacterium]|nr:TOBE domain-containing protein [Candidatus Obscuribacterales bacterium]
MKTGARNKIKGTVSSIKSDQVMSLVKFETASGEMASVLTTESVEDMNLRLGDEVELVIKAINVLPVKA